MLVGVDADSTYCYLLSLGQHRDGDTWGVRWLEAVALADDLALLARWLQHDLLSVAGPEHASRAALWDFVVAELAQREEQYPHRIGSVRRWLQNQKADLD